MTFWNVEIEEISYLFKRIGCVTFPVPNFSGLGFPGGSVVENLPANAGDAGDVGLIPGSGRSP